MKYKIEYPTKIDIEKMNKVATDIFGNGDETMVNPTPENDKRIIALEENTFVCYKKNNTPVAWSLVLPTSKENAKQFLDKEITERELFDTSTQNPSFESLYLFVVVTMPDYRKKGLGSSLMKYQIDYFKNKYKIKNFYAWALNNEGKSLIESLKRDIEPTIRFISKV